MNVQVPAYWGQIKYHLNDHLYINSFFMLATKLLLAGSGFIFWMIAARLYSVEQVGIGVAMISSVTLITTLSMFGFENSIIRFYSTYDKAKVVNTSIMIAGVASLVIGAAYSLVMHFVSPQLSLIDNPLYLLAYLALVVLSTMATVSGNAFVAMRKSVQLLAQNLVASSRIILLVPLLFLGSFGIIGSTLLSFVFAMAFVVVVLGSFVRLDYRIDREFVSRSLHFSAGNYLGGLFNDVPYLIMPTLVLGLLGEAAAARYYVAFSIGALLMQITYTVSTSLFVEGSNGRGIRQNVVKSGLAIYALLVPAVVCVFLFGNYLLGLYGSAYTETFDLLKLFAIATLFQAIYWLFCTVKRVTMGVRSIVLMNALMFVLSLSLSWALIPRFGLNGVGLAFIATFVVTDVAVLGLAKREGWV